MCIYFGDAPDTYNKSEHIFRQAGRDRDAHRRDGCPIRQTSSSLRWRGELMHDSLLALDRYFFGPGRPTGQDSKSNVTVGVQDDSKNHAVLLVDGKAVLG